MRTDIEVCSDLAWLAHAIDLNARPFRVWFVTLKAIPRSRLKNARTFSVVKDV